MNSFQYYQPTRIHFGWRETEKIGKIVKKYGKRCLLVTGPSPALQPVNQKVINFIQNEGVEVIHFNGVVPNPTTDSINHGATMAKEFKADVILGMGGGSSMDTAKAIAIEAVNEGGAWDYRVFSGKYLSSQTLPNLAITTTSGTGSQVTAVSVITNPNEKFKSAIVDPLLFPRECIVDPQLMMTVPEHITASTGFDAFSHAFESFIHKKANPYTDMLAIEAMRIIKEYLPRAVKNGSDQIARSQMAWADILAGLCIANAGTTLPHGIGMAVGGNAPQVMHGEALSVIYPEFMKYTYHSSIPKFAMIGRIFKIDLKMVSDEIAAEKSAEALTTFLKEIGMWLSFEDLRVGQSELDKITEDSLKLPDYMVNPRVATQEEIFSILEKCYKKG